MAGGALGRDQRPYTALVLWLAPRVAPGVGAMGQLLFVATMDSAQDYGSALDISRLLLLWWFPVSVPSL